MVQFLMNICVADNIAQVPKYSCTLIAVICVTLLIGLPCQQVLVDGYCF